LHDALPISGLPSRLRKNNVVPANTKAQPSGACRTVELGVSACTPRYTDATNRQATPAKIPIERRAMLHCGARPFKARESSVPAEKNWNSTKLFVHWLLKPCQPFQAYQVTVP